MVANGPKCWRVDDCDGAVPVSPHAMVSTTAHWAQVRVTTGGGGRGHGDSDNKNRARQPRVKNINMGRTRHH